MWRWRLQSTEVAFEENSSSRGCCCDDDESFVAEARSWTEAALRNNQIEQRDKSSVQQRLAGIPKELAEKHSLEKAEKGFSE